MYIDMYTYTYMPIHIHLYINAYLHIHIHICIHIYIYIYTYIYSHATQPGFCSRNVNKSAIVSTPGRSCANSHPYEDRRPRLRFTPDTYTGDNRMKRCKHRYIHVRIHYIYIRLKLCKFANSRDLVSGIHFGGEVQPVCALLPDGGCLFVDGSQGHAMAEIDKTIVRSKFNYSHSIIYI